ncbi:MAG: DUF4199 domain-containing protein [Prolixibacteraceae bacterium]|nr:DUF4199 domain-containing protein [Prolixibacteraceae bacterium]MBN2774319.1 DUF4199 domain-containing protein [Prolixibacteraceae bacterium]
MEQKSSLLKSSLIYGLYLGLISILISVVIWATSLMEIMGIFGTSIIGLLSLIITFILLLVFTKSYRKKDLGGSITFGQAFLFGLLVMIFCTILTSIYNYVFSTIIDPEYTERLMAVLQQKTMEYMERVGAPESQINKAMERFGDVPTVFESIKRNVMYGVIGGAVMSLIIAASIRKKPKEEMDIE